VFDGRKLIGSAQVRKRGVVLQHGALPLFGDIARICDVLSGKPDKERVRARATTIECALGHTVTYDEAMQTMCDGFASALTLQLEPGGLTTQEAMWADELYHAKYACEEWTKRI
jgi:lipoate-protein ligase A